MAYVANSRSIRSEVRYNIERMRDAEIKSHPRPDTVAFNATTDAWLIPLAWGPLHGSAFVGHPELTVDRDTEVIFKIVGVKDLGRNETVELNVAGVPKHAFFNGSSYKWQPTIKVTTASHQYFADHVAWVQNTNEIQARWQGILNQVGEFLDACKSVNEAIKLWPDLRRYLDKETITKLDRRVEKSKSDSSSAIERLKKLDIEQITASTVAARFAAAGARNE